MRARGTRCGRHRCSQRHLDTLCCIDVQLSISCGHVVDVSGVLSVQSVVLHPETLRMRVRVRDGHVVDVIGVLSVIWTRCGVIDVQLSISRGCVQLGDVQRQFLRLHW